MPSETVEATQALTFDGNAQARDETSWWSKTSWFSAPGAAPLPVPDAGVAPPQQSKDITAAIQALPAGGANAQCRFAGRCHIPIGTSAPVSGSPLPLAMMRQPAAFTPAQGQTCDGRSPAWRATGNAVLGSAQHSRAWTFNLDKWRWERADGAVQEGANEGVGDGPNADKHALAARRWGDGRDGLAAAVKRAKLDNGPEPTASPAASALAFDLAAAEQGTEKQASDVAERSGPVGFAAVGGLHVQKEALRRAIVLPLRHPELLRVLGARPGRGALLHGPPGSGKTLLAAALAAEAGVHLETINGAEAVAGQAAETKLRNAFDKARANAPSVLLIDEIDAIVPARDGIASESERQAGARLMAQLDGLAASSAAVAVVATTSRAGALDPAIRRPGRLDVEVAFGALPTAERLEVLRLLTAGMPLATDVDLASLAEAMRGFVGADCRAAVTEAALECVKEAVDAAEAAAPGIELGEPELQAQELAQQLRVAGRHLSSALGRTRPSSLRGLTPEVPSASWADVGGLGPVKRALRELIELPLKRPELLAKFGMSAPRGALLYGPPGCGKTLLARAAAAQCGANFLSVRGPELLDRWLGQSEANVRNIFAAARGAAPCIIFFDEMDAIAPRRSGAAGTGCAAGDSAAARVLNQLLAEMDGLSSGGGGGGAVFVLGATNRPEALDPALLRPGRMDALLKVPLPDEAARLAVLQAALRRSPLAPDVDLTAMAATTGGFSGADLAEVVRRAGRLAIRECIRSERQPTITGATAAEHHITAAHLATALEGARCSVSPDQTAHYDEIERGFLTGGVADTAVQRAAQTAQVKQQAQQREALVKAAVARATDSVAAQKIAALEAELLRRDSLIADLRGALASASADATSS